MTKYKSSTVDRSWKTAIKNAEQRRRDKKKFSDTEQMPKPTEVRPHELPHKQGDSPEKRIKSDLNVNEYDLSTKPTGGEDNSPNALEIGLKKAKEKAEEKESDGITRPRRVFYKMKGFPRQLVGDQKNLPQKEISDAPAVSRYNSETMEMENLKPVNRTALQMTGREGDTIPLSRMNSYSSFPKRSAAGKANLMKTAYGQSGKAIPNKQLIQPIFKKAKKDS